MKKFLSRHNWKGLLGILRFAVAPVQVMRWYYGRRGSYPYRLGLKTPVGPIWLTMHSHDDLITVHEIFFREDYRVRIADDGRVHTIVDFGTNIGVAAAYFASRATSVQVYAYEPVPVNIERAKANLAPFGTRVRLTECAVGVDVGMVSFGVETTGRYGGIGLPHGTQIEVPCRPGAAEVAEILTQAERIDVLKLDIEGMELPILRALDAATLTRIERIYAECDGSAIRLSPFRCEQVLSVAHFHR